MAARVKNARPGCVGRSNRKPSSLPFSSSVLLGRKEGKEEGILLLGPISHRHSQIGLDGAMTALTKEVKKHLFLTFLGKPEVCLKLT